MDMEELHLLKPSGFELGQQYSKSGHVTVAQKPVPPTGNKKTIRLKERHRNVFSRKGYSNDILKTFFEQINNYL